MRRDGWDFNELSGFPMAVEVDGPMKWSGVSFFMRMTGCLSGGPGVHWLSVPEQKKDSFSDILELNAIGRRPLRISSTVTKEKGIPVVGGETHAPVRSGR